MKTLLLQLVPGLALALAWLSASAAAATRPNIVFILADDLGWADVGFHGSQIKTPHLDRLAREGVTLDQFYVAPMCSPTRAALLTGRYASRFGCTAATNERVLPFGTVTLAAALKASGYDTAISGKWHLGSKPEWGPLKFGFDKSYGSLAGGTGPYDHRYKKGEFTRTWHRDDQLIDEEGHVTDLIAREAIRWLEARGSNPFFLYVPFTAVHIPIDEPKEWLELYGHIADPAKRQYAACLTHLDDAIGRIVTALERSSQREQTLIIFHSDNGATPTARNDDRNYPSAYTSGQAGGSNVPWRGHKTEIYEGGIRVPAFVHWPKQLKPRLVKAPVHAVDWMPTLTRLAGSMPKNDLKWDGQDIWPLLTSDDHSASPRTLYSAGVHHRSAALREGHWKLVQHYGDSPRTELFHIGDDPNERSNLAAKFPERVSILQELLAAQAARDHDAVVSPRRQN